MVAQVVAAGYTNLHNTLPTRNLQRLCSADSINEKQNTRLLNFS